METIQNIKYKIEPFYITVSFELKRKWKIWVGFSGIAVFFVLLASVFPYTLIPDNPPPVDQFDTQLDYFQDGIFFLPTIIIFATCFFFSGIICEEFYQKTGNITFPMVNRYKLLLGKITGSLLMLIGVTIIFYLTLGVAGTYFFEEPINILLFYSLGITIFYLIAVSALVTFFSSIMRNVSIVMISSVLLLIVGERMFNNLIFPLLFAEGEIEPLISFDYLSNLIYYVMEEDFFPADVDDRYIEVTRGEGDTEFTYIKWLTPTLEVGIMVMIIYFIIFYGLALIIFKNRQL